MSENQENQELSIQLLSLEEENRELQSQLKRIEESLPANSSKVVFQLLDTIEKNERTIDKIQNEILQFEFEKSNLEEQIGVLQSQAFNAQNQSNQSGQQQKEQQQQQSSKSSTYNNQQNFFKVPSQVIQNIPRISKCKELTQLNNLENEKLQVLLSSYSHFREVRNDGNSFYRAVGFALLESFISPLTQTDKILQFIKNLSKKILQADKQYEKLRATWLQTLDWIIEQKNKKVPTREIIEQLIQKVNENKEMLDEAIF